MEQTTICQVFQNHNWERCYAVCNTQGNIKNRIQFLNQFFKWKSLQNISNLSPWIQNWRNVANNMPPDYRHYFAVELPMATIFAVEHCIGFALPPAVQAMLLFMSARWCYPWHNMNSRFILLKNWLLWLVAQKCSSLDAFLKLLVCGTMMKLRHVTLLMIKGRDTWPSNAFATDNTAIPWMWIHTMTVCTKHSAFVVNLVCNNATRHCEYCTTQTSARVCLSTNYAKATLNSPKSKEEVVPFGSTTFTQSS